MCQIQLLNHKTSISSIEMAVATTKFICSQESSATEILRKKGLFSTEKENLENTEDVEIWEEKVAREKQEWDALDDLKSSVSGVVIATEDITFSETLQHFQNITFSIPIRDRQRSKFSQFMHLLFGPRPLNKALVKERDLILNITNVALNNNDTLHCRVLQTIYKSLTGSIHNCPRFGSHWEIIGFQGNDPATDLRGAGFLALLQLLFLVTENKFIGKEIYQLSIHQEQNFPFCLVSINVTRIALLALKNDALSSVCNKRKQVVTTINDFYIAVFWNIYETWKKGFKTMSDSGHVLKAAEENALKNPNVLLKTMEATLKQKRKSQLNFTPQAVAGRLSTASSLSDSSLQSPALPSQSLDAVLHPFDEELEHCKSLDNPQFSGVLELSTENLHT